MSETISHRRLTENEMVYRNRNEKVQKGFDELKEIAVEDGQEYILFDNDLELEFFCECSDENCRNRITLKLSDYKKVHDSRDKFIVIPKHCSGDIEHVIHKERNYWVVQKFETPPKKTPKLHKTDLNFSK